MEYRLIIGAHPSEASERLSTPTRAITDWQTREKIEGRAEDWTIRRNVIVADDPDQLLFDTPGWDFFMTTLDAQHNVYDRPGSDAGFHIGDDLLTFAEWRAGYDRESLFADPQFVDPADGDFRRSPGSPLSRMGR